MDLRLAAFLQALALSGLFHHRLLLLSTLLYNFLLQYMFKLCFNVIVYFISAERTFRKAPQKPPSSVRVHGVDPTRVRVTWRYVAPSLEEEPLTGYKVKSVMNIRLLFFFFFLHNSY